MSKNNCYLKFSNSVVSAWVVAFEELYVRDVPVSRKLVLDVEATTALLLPPPPQLIRKEIEVNTIKNLTNLISKLCFTMK